MHINASYLDNGYNISFVINRTSKTYDQQAESEKNVKQRHESVYKDENQSHIEGKYRNNNSVYDSSSKNVIEEYLIFYVVKMSNDTTSSPLELKMELYSIVLSVSTLCLAILFGSGGNITVFLSLCTCKMLAKLRYILLAMLLILSLIFDVFWCSMEIYRLLYHQHSDQEMDIVLKYVEQSLYIFLVAALLVS
ncbi:hypothetical protein KUTeg_001203 [Tegillarca granosa]|uniref:G-protein coupled receptors family 1 profile domain-containing protein n=1 Tax=Tegillarca granosa TaxID=220873 RepID=A0ABQ9FVJ5_TEGGR|nr:hypothetical protein KUTeg_001203 [Tegillarca granosa]